VWAREPGHIMPEPSDPFNQEPARCEPRNRPGKTRFSLNTTTVRRRSHERSRYLRIQRATSCLQPVRDCHGRGEHGLETTRGTLEPVVIGEECRNSCDPVRADPAPPMNAAPYAERLTTDRQKWRRGTFRWRFCGEPPFLTSPFLNVDSQ
jgi:hypothetical protein